MPADKSFRTPTALSDAIHAFERAGALEFDSAAPPGGGVSRDHGDDRASATEVEAESETQGELTAGDVGYFRVVIGTLGTLEAYTSGGADTLGRLEEADGAVLRTNDDGGAATGSLPTQSTYSSMPAR